MIFSTFKWPSVLLNDLQYFEWTFSSSNWPSVLWTDLRYFELTFSTLNWPSVLWTDLSTSNWPSVLQTDLHIFKLTFTGWHFFAGKTDHNVPQQFYHHPNVIPNSMSQGNLMLRNCSTFVGNSESIPLTLSAATMLSNNDNRDNYVQLRSSADNLLQHQMVRKTFLIVLIDCQRLTNQIKAVLDKTWFKPQLYSNNKLKWLPREIITPI